MANDVIVKQIVCLANSRKLSGRCLAGKMIKDGKAGDWVRPVSGAHDAVSEEERRYQNGTEPELLDIVQVPVVSSCSKDCQTENWLLNPDYYWTKLGMLDRADLSAFADPVAPLWLDGESTVNGINDKISLGDATDLTSSLRFILVEHLIVSVFVPSAMFGSIKRRVQGRFEFSGVTYGLWITDPIVEAKYLSQANGKYAMGQCYLTISIGEPYYGFCYKLIAAVIPCVGEVK